MKKQFLLIVLLCPLILFSQNRYVDGNTGNDSNNGTTLGHAWRTIQKACNAAPAGSTVYIRGGNYIEQLWMNVSGTASNYLTFTHFGTEMVVVDGNNVNAQTELLNISGKHYIKIIGLHFANATGNFSKGITIRNGSDHIEIRSCKFYNIHFSNNSADAPAGKNSNPFLTYNENAADASTDIIFNDNEIYNCRTGVSEACTMNGNVDGFEISNNRVYNITNIGIDAAGGYGVCPNPAKDAARNGIILRNTVYNCVSALAVSAGIYIDGGQNIQVAYNVCFDNGRGFEIGCEQQNHITKNIVLHNNLCYHNREAGIGIGGYNYPNTGKVMNCVVRNNTCYDNAFTNNGDGELLIEYAENCAVEQNIFYATNLSKNLMVTRLNATGIILNYNLFYHAEGAANATVDWNGTIYTNYANYQSGVGQDGQSPFGNPLFTAASTPDFKLNSGSPGINTGRTDFTPLAGETDYAANYRIAGGRVDIGAYESMSVLSVEYTSPLRAIPVQSSIQLEWTTASEWDHARFDIERSGENFQFKVIGTLPCIAHKSPNNYHFSDNSPLGGINYYRLKTVEKSGAVQYSPAVFVLWEIPSVHIFPNPSKGTFWIEYDGNFSNIMVYDALGWLIKSIKEPQNRVNLGGVLPGVYWVEVIDVVARRVWLERVVVE